MRAYKRLKEAEKGFGGLKGPVVRPIHHRLEDRVRAHLLICMLAEYVRWHLRHAWAELLFQDDSPISNTDPVLKATRSPEATRKTGRRRTPQHEPCQTIASLFDELENRPEQDRARDVSRETLFPRRSATESHVASQPSMRALIVDEGRERSSVSAARALDSAGWTVGAASARPNLAWRSRATTAWHEVAHRTMGTTSSPQVSTQSFVATDMTRCLSCGTAPLQRSPSDVEASGSRWVTARTRAC